MRPDRSNGLSELRQHRRSGFLDLCGPFSIAVIPGSSRVLRDVFRDQQNLNVKRCYVTVPAAFKRGDSGVTPSLAQRDAVTLSYCA